MTRAVGLGLLSVVLLAAEAAPVRADVPGPDGKATRRPWGYGAPPPGWFEQNNSQNPPPAPLPVPDPAPKPDSSAPGPQPQPAVDPATGAPTRVSRDPPPPRQRTGPFRTCGSGIGVGLAGIGMAWAMLWLGNRFAGRVSRNAKK